MDETKRLATAVHNLSHILAEIIADHPEPLIDGLTKQEAIDELREMVHDVLVPLVYDHPIQSYRTGGLPQSNDGIIRGSKTSKKHLHLKLVEC